jgi:hypothetical protein
MRLGGAWTTTGMTVVLAVVLAGGLGAAPPRDPVGRARQLYNEGKWDEAIVAATEARRLPQAADAANLVLARAHMERFRVAADPLDLEAGRAALQSIQVATLAPRARIDYLIGLGESLYLDDQFGAAAELFETVLSRADEIGPGAYDRVLDWWASAMDREAQGRQRSDRAPIYRRLVERLQHELEQHPGSGPAAYWLPAALRAEGDLDRAWDAAVAAWVRAPLTLERAPGLRADVDRLMQQAIIPERGRQTAREAELRAAWDDVKRKWSQGAK